LRGLEEKGGETEEVAKTLVRMNCEQGDSDKVHKKNL